jgi:predicted protein tyrosine phosphatase
LEAHSATAAVAGFTCGRHPRRSGVRLHCVDADAEHAVTRDTLLRWADIRPFLERTRRLKLQALAR